jgi:ribosome-associated translation inhibitor RaiA
MRNRDTMILNLPPVTVVVRGAVVPDDAAYAENAVTRTIEGADRPVDGSRVRITGYAGGGDPPFAVAQINLKVGARLVRAQASAPTATDAVDRAVDSLRQRLNRLCRHLAAEEAGAITFTAHEWTPPAPAGAVAFAGPPGGLLRCKPYPLAVQSIDAAAITMDLRDYPFHLFIEAGTETECVIHRGGPTGYRLRRVAATVESIETAVPLTVWPQPAPSLRVADAVRLLNAAPAQRFLFFAHPFTDSGAVIYRRFDGRLVLMGPG